MASVSNSLWLGPKLPPVTQEGPSAGLRPTLAANRLWMPKSRQQVSKSEMRTVMTLKMAAHQQKAEEDQGGILQLLPQRQTALASHWPELSGLSSSCTAEGPPSPGLPDRHLAEWAIACHCEAGADGKRSKCRGAQGAGSHTAPPSGGWVTHGPTLS